jgi:hypothetical protein
VSTQVGPVVYSIYVNGVLIQDKPLDARLKQTWGQHDLWAIRIEYNRLFPMNAIQVWPDNALVQITWGRSPSALNQWFGYVNHSQQDSHADSGTNNLQYTYYCLGTSKPMNTMNSFVWGSVSPTYIAKQMALRYHLRCAFTPTTTVLTAATQASMSDFNYMNSLADQNGYRFWVSGGTMYFINPAVLLQGTPRQAVPFYRQDKTLTQQDTMRYFRQLSGDNLPGSTVGTRTISGIDSTSGHLFTTSVASPGSSSTTSTVTLNNTTRVAQSLSEGQSILSASSGLSQFWIGASAELFGNNLIYPGKIVYLDGNALPGGNIGYWIVVSAEQILLSAGTPNPANDKYVTKCILMRNTNATIPAIQGTVVVNPEFVPCVASKGVWYSTSLQVIQNGVVNG